MHKADLLRRKLFLLHCVVLAVFCLSLAAGISLPLYNTLSGRVAEEFTSSVRRQSAAVAQYILRAEELASQITSRTRIRQELEKFNRGEIGLGQLAAFTMPKLEDALHRSGEVMGITRLDALGREVVSVGIRPPKKALKAGAGAGLGGSFIYKARNLVWVRAPILDRRRKEVGTDVVVVSTSRLNDIICVAEGSALNAGLWGTLLTISNDIEYRHLIHDEACKGLAGAAMAVRGVLDAAVAAGGRKKLVSYRYENLFCVASPVNGSDWLLVGCLDRDRMNAPIIRQAGWVLLIALALYLLCLAGYWLALSPLSRRFLLHQDELEREVGDKTRSLEAELAARQQAESKLADQRRRLENILEGTDAGTWEWEIRTGKVAVNQRFAKMLGYTLEEISPVDIGAWERFCHPEDLAASERELQRHFRGETKMFRCDVRLRHKNGSWVWISDRGKVAARDENGEPLFMFGTHQDITKRKLAEQALMESEERLRTLIDSTPDTICFKDGQGRWLEANGANLKSFGLETVDYRGKTDAELAGLTEPIYGQALSACRESDEAAWKSGEPFRTEESITCDDGSLKFFDVIKVPLFREDGGRRGIIVLGRDVTQRKITEKANRRLEGQLRQAHKMQAVGTLAGGIAHDFNNILAAILGYAEIATEKAGKGAPAPRELEQITKAADRASILVRQILTFSRKMGSEKAPMDINKLVNESASVIKRTIPKMISTEVKLSEEPAIVIGDTAQIQSMLLNLATNARDAMPDGGRLLIRTGLCEAKDKVCNGCGRIFSGKYARVSVSDTGQGMDRETMNHMFDPFFTTKEVGKGTGLGMATVFGILREHGGHVVCESAPGRGSAFHLYLPLAETDEKPQGEPGGDPLACQGRGEKILVVDDEEPLREMAQSALEHCGYRVTTAETGEQALDIYRREEYGFDLVVMDVNMPGMGGAKCLARMIELNPKAKVLLASGYAQEEDEAGGAASRAVGYLAKPYRLAELLDVIRKLIDG